MALIVHFAVFLSLIQIIVAQKFPAIFQFGDSLSDPGNKVIAFPDISHRYTQPPYGMTYFGHPTGRNTDGRLIVDFIASALGLPFLNPYLLTSANFQYGANFAVQGAGALSFNYIHSHNFTFENATFQLDTQLQWFLQFQKDAARKSKLGKFPSAKQFAEGLYIVGEIGGNDYFNIYKNGVSFKGLSQYVPLVIRSIEKVIQGLYQAGARNFLIINLPITGCNPTFLIQRDPKQQYDKLGCLSEFNKVGQLHRSMLKSTVEDLSQELTDSVFTIGDFYGVMEKIINNYHDYGFKHLSEVCCGIFTNTITLKCGDSVTINGVELTAKACDNPSDYIFWNDFHFTEAFYKIVADSFMSGEYSYTYGARSAYTS